MSSSSKETEELEDLSENVMKEEESTKLMQADETPEAKNPELDAKNPELEAKSPEFEAKSPGLQAKSPGLQAKSPELEAKSPELEAKSLELEAKSPELHAKSPELQAKSPELEAKSPELQAKSPESKAKSPKSEENELDESMTGKIFPNPKSFNFLLEMRENLARETRGLILNEDDDEEFKSITSSSGSDYSDTSKEHVKLDPIPDSDEELLKTFESMPKPESPIIPESFDEFLGIDGMPIIDEYSGLLPGELPARPTSFCQELQNNDIISREVFNRSPNQNMGEILSVILDDYEEPRPLDMEELYDLALIETDEQIYEENYLRHSMALAVFEDKNIDELKKLLENVKKQPL